MKQTLTKKQINDVKFNKFSITTEPDKPALCHFMYRCPSSPDLPTCSPCIGTIPIKELIPIQPKLTLGNLEKTINIWEVLFK